MPRERAKKTRKWERGYGGGKRALGSLMAKIKRVHTKAQRKRAARSVDKTGREEGDEVTRCFQEE